MSNQKFSGKLMRSAAGAALFALTVVSTAIPGSAQSLPQPRTNAPVPGLPQPGTPQPLNPGLPAAPPNSGKIEQFDAESYILGPGDVISVDMFNQPEISKAYRVLIDGTVSLPMVGNVPVRGLTLRQAADAISTRYAKYFRRPVVTTRLDANRPVTIGVSGQVFRPGTYLLGSDTSTGQGVQTSRVPKVSFAIQTAGGITPKADIRNVQIRRPQAGRPDTIINVDLWRIIREGDLSQDIALRDGDSVVIPESTTVTAAEATQLALTTFSPATINVNVVGEVKGPGLKQLIPNTPLNNAILAAGGFVPGRANPNKVKLIRLNPDGTVTQQELKIDLAQGISQEGNPTLQNNDVIVVGRSGLASFSDTLGQVMSPFNGITGTLTRFLPIP
jgi:polysaccharide export outer membrane protein